MEEHQQQLDQAKCQTEILENLIVHAGSLAVPPLHPGSAVRLHKMGEGDNTCPSHSKNGFGHGTGKPVSCGGMVAVAAVRGDPGVSTQQA